MGRINLSSTSQEILAIYFANPGQKFYVNELIRRTGRYPNSVQQALKSLEKQEILLPSRRGRFKLLTLNQSYKFLSEIERVLEKQGLLKRVQKYKEESQWIKVVNRKSVPACDVEIARAQRDLLPKFIGVGIGTYWHNAVTDGIYYPQEELIKVGVTIGTKLKKDPEFPREATRFYKNLLIRLVKTAKTLPQDTTKLRRLNNQQLARWLSKFQKVYYEAMTVISFPDALEEVILREIKEELEEKLIDLGRLELFDEYLEKLTSPIEQKVEERDGILKIAAYVKKNGWDKRAHRLLDKHTQEFAYLPLWPFSSQPFGRSYFEEELKVILGKVKDPLKEIKRGREEERKRKTEAKKILLEIKADSNFKKKIKLLQDYVFLRTFRNESIRKAEYYHLPLLHEIARALGISFGELCFLSYDEMLFLLKNPSKKLTGEINKRMEGWAFLIWKGKMKIIVGVKDIIEAMERYRIVAPGPQAARMIKGNPACRGKATGRVKIVRRLKELSKIEEGDILVTKMTTPDYMMAIHKAAAIVTDEGGVTCHAAIVSREFNLPCIVGTKNATQTLSDNDLVEVDADEGIVRVVEAVEIDEDVKEIYGKTAFKGKVRGTTRIVLDAKDFPKVKEGDILVTSQTTPEYLSSLYKVKGFIVDEESITSHAMLYAKALKLPAVIGTQFARNLLQDGEKIELDASNGVVKRLKK